MRVPEDAVIPWEKLTDCLLAPRLRDDKSRFLARAGFLQSNAEDLLRALRELAVTQDAVEDGESEYGVFLRAEGELIGPSGGALQVVTIWLRWHSDGSTHFVTLKPGRWTTDGG